LDHAPAAVKLLTAEPKQAGFAAPSATEDIKQDSTSITISIRGMKFSSL